MSHVVEVAQQQVPVWLDNEYYAQAEGAMAEQWRGLIYPRLTDCRADYRHVVDLACGRGRNTAQLLLLAERVTVVDLCVENLNFVRRRFAGVHKLEVARTDGASIPLPTGTVSLVYSFDAMVHFAPEVVCAYLHEAARVLELGGLTFMHVSNYWPEEGVQHDGSDNGWRYHPHARNLMCGTLLHYTARTAGLSVFQSDVIDWGKARSLDRLVVLRRTR